MMFLYCGSTALLEPGLMGSVSYGPFSLSPSQLVGFLIFPYQSEVK